MAIACMCPGWDNTQGVDLVSCIIRIIYLLWYNTQRIIAAKRMQGARGRNPQDQAGAPEKRADASDEQKQRAEKYEKIRRDAAIDQEREAEFMRNTDPSKISDHHNLCKSVKLLVWAMLSHIHEIKEAGTRSSRL